MCVKRIIGDKLHTTFGTEKSVVISDTNKNSKDILLITEGLALSNYTFTKHQTNPKKNRLKEILDSNVPEFPKQVQLNIPGAPSKMQLPKLQ